MSETTVKPKRRRAPIVGFSTQTGLNLADIDPKKGTKYSPNLYKFMSNPSNEAMAKFARLYRDAAGDLHLGIIDYKGMFTGHQLSLILCGVAKRANTYLDMGPLTLLPNFWVEYVKDGRCAIDREHDIPFIGSQHRWETSGSVRKCLWCDNKMQSLQLRPNRKGTLEPQWV